MEQKILSKAAVCLFVEGNIWHKIQTEAKARTNCGILATKKVLSSKIST